MKVVLHKLEEDKMMTTMNLKQLAVYACSRVQYNAIGLLRAMEPMFNFNSNDR